MRHSIALLVLGTVFATACGSNPRPKAQELGPFDSTAAMRTLFGNFDPVIKASLYRVPEGGVQDANFAHKDEIRVRPFFVQETTEDGVRKYYMLTWAKPAGQPFDCKGCAPLISAAVFVPANNAWQLESVNRASSVFGDFGKPPEAQLVQIGPQHHALLLRVTSSLANTTTKEALLVPWKGTVQEAMHTTAADTNQGDCGGAYPCYGFQRDLKFVPGSTSVYDDIILTLSGTDMSPKAPFRVHKVSGTERLRFQDGTYVEIEKSGEAVIAERR